MKKLSINFIGFEEEPFSAALVSKRFGTHDVSLPLMEADSIESTQPDERMLPIKRLVDNSIGTSKPSAIKLPKYEMTDLEKAYHFAGADTDIRNYYPELSSNPIIGTASNKTLGTFPLFSSAVLAPAGVWDKRRKAIGEYMLALEKQKNQPDAGLNYEYTPTEGASPWMKVYNENAIEDLHSIEKEGREQKISMKDAGRLGHPYNNAVNTTVNNVKSGLKTVTDIEKNISDIETKNLNLDNRVGQRTASAIELYKYLSGLPENNPVEFGGVVYQGKKELARSQGFKDAMDELNQDLTIDNDLLSLADNRVKQLEKNSIEEAKIQGYGENYIQYTKDKISSKYPIKQNADGSLSVPTEDYLTDIATQIAKSRKSYFKEFAIDKDRAEYTIDDLKEILSSSLGIERVHAEPIAVTGQGGGAAANTVNAAPQYVKGTLEKLNRGEIVQGKSGKSTITSGDIYTTVMTNGQLKIIPNGSVVEVAKAIAESGAADNEYGSVDAPTAIVQMNTGVDADKTYKEFQNARPVTKGLRLAIPKDGSQQERFNQSIRSFAGDKGAPIAGGDEVWVSKMNSIATDKSDSKFFFTLRDKNSNISTNGVIIPKDKVTATVTNPDAGLWDKYGLGDDKVSMFVPKGQDAVIIDGAYYKYNPSSADDVASYTIYDKKTNSPMKFPGKEKFDEPYEVKVPEYYVKNILSTPEKLVTEANEVYKGDKESPSATQMTTVTGTKTKTGGKGTTMTIENNKAVIPDERLRVIKFMMSQGKSYEDAVRIENSYATSTKADTKDLYAKMKQKSAKYDISDIKSGNIKPEKKTIDKNDTWIGKIMDFEKSSGGFNSQTGKPYGLDNYGYNSKNPKSKEEAIKFFKQEYLPRVKEYPENLQPRLADYIYNTGRNPKDLLLYATGYIGLGDINSLKSFDKLYDEKKSEIEKKMKSKDFIGLLDSAKIDIYQTTGGYTLESPNPAYDATWHNRIRIFDK